ncbi:AP-2 complex subunit alpha-2 [Perkinsus olseni]|uniref:AP-2 complex subunit alpha n=2 Tax=Perkinsus olseni TaxID=32597 RepID=A0A7J6NTF1_PEROL|nr:AP-2 complex subunit alpha-2 [Perkinsus olseni]
MPGLTTGNSGSMKGLTVFVSDIRNCPNKEAENQRVEKELAKIRTKFASPKGLKGYDKKKYVWKLIYAYMLGYEIDFGHIQAVNLCSSTKYSEKNAGYIACSLLLQENYDVLRLIVNACKADIASNNEHVQALALNCIANTGGSEFAENLYRDVSGLLSKNHGASLYVQRKACMCLLRFYREVDSPEDLMPAEEWSHKIGDILSNEKDIGMLTATAGLLGGILESGATPPTSWAPVIPGIVVALSAVVTGECPSHYVYYKVPAPWLQAKLFRCLQFFPVMTCFDDAIIYRLNEILGRVLGKAVMEVQEQSIPKASSKKGGLKKSRASNRADAERVNRSNAENGVLFETTNLIIHLGDECSMDNRRTCVQLLGGFISSKEANIRYLGMDAMARLATAVSTSMASKGKGPHLDWVHQLNLFDKYKTVIVRQLHENDPSIQRQALNLLYAICNPSNWQVIVDELLEALASTSGPRPAPSSIDKFRESEPSAAAGIHEELILKIAILAEVNAPDPTWYVDVVFKMLEYSPESVSQDVWFRVVQVVTGFVNSDVDDDTLDIVQQYAAEKGMEACKSSSYPHETLVKLAAYLMGEFGHFLVNAGKTTPLEIVRLLQKHMGRVSAETKCIIMMCYAKLLNANPEDKELKDEVLLIFEDYQDSLDCGLQQRACELSRLFTIGGDSMVETTLAMMPAYPIEAQENNPLKQRIKTQGKTRATTRKQLEEAAAAEGGVYQQGDVKQEEGLLSNNASGQNLNVVGGAAAAAPVVAVAGPSGPAPPSEGSVSSSDSEEESDDEEGERPTPPGVLWKQLCVSDQGSFFQSNSLHINMKAEYGHGIGRLALQFINKGEDVTISNIKTQVPADPSDGFRVRSTPLKPDTLEPAQQAIEYIRVECLRPFLQPPRFLVTFNVNGRDTKQLPMTLPCVLTKFIAPAAISAQQFLQFWQDMQSGGREAMVTSQAKVPYTQYEGYVSKAFNFHIISLPDAMANGAGGRVHTIAAAGTLLTQTPQPGQSGPNARHVAIACMLRIDTDLSKKPNLVRITARTANPQVSRALASIIASHLLEPSSRRQQQQQAGQ